MGANSENILSGSKIEASKNFCNLFFISNILNKKPFKKVIIIFYINNDLEYVSKFSHFQGHSISSIYKVSTFPC